MRQPDEVIYRKAGQFMQVHPKVQKEIPILVSIVGLTFPSDSFYPGKEKGTNENGQIQ